MQSAMSGVLAKMLEPMMIPTMMQTESKRPSCRLGEAVGGGAAVAGLVVKV
jgi:hypothetical protein